MQRGPEHRYEYVNQAYQDFFPGRQLVGYPVAEALPETVDGGVVALLDQVYQTGETYYGYELLLLLPLLLPQPDGQPAKQMYITFAHQAYRENGEIVGISTFVYDVAERVGAQQRIEAYATELQESEARFRTKADAVLNMVWAVHPDSTIRYINRAFLDFVGLGTEQEYVATGWGPYLHPYEAERTQQTLTQAIEQQQPYIMEHHLLHRTNVDLDNLIYTASHDLKTPISNIEGLSENGHHVLEVYDNGLGLDLTQGEAKLFGMFERLHTHVEGTSVGLYMVKRSVENGGGRIKVDSQLGHGSTFRGAASAVARLAAVNELSRAAIISRATRISRTFH